MNTTEPVIDRQQLRALLKCYWRLSTRGRVARAMGKGNKPRGLIFVLVMYLVVGFVTGMMAFSSIDLFTYTIIIHAITFFVVGMAITSESGDILFNANESDVLVHRPIHPRTLLLAKTLNLVGFTLLLATALNFFPTFFGIAVNDARPWFPVIHLFSMIVLCIFCASAVVCVYGLVIKFLDREKFDNFAAWSQIAMSVLFIGGYQVVPRLLERFDGLTLRPYASYLFALPPAWFAGLDSAIAGNMPFGLVLALIGLLLTLTLSYVAIGRLSTSYSEGLAKISETAVAAPTPARAGKHRELRNPLLLWWLRDPIELRSFRLAAAYMRRDRDIKLRLYPSLTIFVVIPVMALLDRKGGLSIFAAVVTVWMLALMPYQALQTLQMSQNYLAADIFSIAPLRSAAPVFHGVRKATIVYLLLPALGIAALLIAFLLPGGLAKLQIALPGVIVMPLLSLAPGLIEDYLPLSRPASRGDQSSRNMGLIFFSMIVMGIIMGAGFIAWTFDVVWYAIGLEMVLGVILYNVLNRRIKNRPLIRYYNDLFSYGKEKDE